MSLSDHREGTDRAGEGRRRRTPGEVDDLILDAAREMFAAKGYAGTSSREIATLAGVHEPAIYRRFGSKAGLFDAAVRRPFNEAIAAYMANYESQLERPRSTEDLVRFWIEPVYRLVSEHRELLVALLAAEQFHDQDQPQERTWELDALLRRMDGQAQVETERRGLGSGGDAGLTVRVSAGMVLGMVLLGDWLLGHGPHRAGDADVVAEMIRMITYGVESRTSAARPAPHTSTMPELALILDRLADAERRAAIAEHELAKLTSTKSS
ncbi:MAG TPA: helix-turn-helix domain-containing protein [Pseudonocardia sp.]|jgi:AcrR family transcriptional regulator|nr:helix-turn-helix domain-containing protein [Pseudonocardia sp.]